MTRGMGRGGEEKEPVERMRAAKGERYAFGGSWDTHGELVDFIYWFLTFLSGSFLFSVSLPGPTMVKNPTGSGCGPFRPAQSLQSTPGWPIACGGASQSFIGRQVQLIKTRERRHINS